MTSDAQKDVWKHNGYIGCAVMMQKQAVAILKSPTATEAAKAIAVRIEQDAYLLELCLRAGRAE